MNLLFCSYSFNCLLLFLRLYILFSFKLLIVLINPIKVSLNLKFTSEKKNDLMKKKSNRVPIFASINFWYLLVHYLSFKLFLKITRLISKSNIICFV